MLKTWQIKFLEAAEHNGTCQVIARAVNHESAIEEGQRRRDEFPAILEPTGCGVDVTGHRHNDHQICDNWYEDDLTHGCRVKDYVREKHKIESLRWMPTMLDYYWLNGIQGDGLLFLSGTGFVVSYE